jgi:hypothetical protein
LTLDGSPIATVALRGVSRPVTERFEPLEVLVELP